MALSHNTLAGHKQTKPMEQSIKVTSPQPNAAEVEFCTLDIVGMTCASCVSHVEKAINKVPGVQAASVNLATEQAKIRFLRQDTQSIENIIQAIDHSGYTATLSRPLGSSPVEREIDFWGPSGLSRVLVGFFLSAPLIAPMLFMPFGVHLSIDPFAQLALALPVQLWLGSRFYVGAYKALKNGSGNMDLLVCLGTTSAFGLSLYLMASAHAHELYFESSSVVISMVLLGKWLEVNAKHKTSGAIRALQKLWPESAHVIDQHQKTHEINLEHILPGDLVKVFPSERIPVDGIVVQGFSWVDESLLTGESSPVEKGVEQKVMGGAINGDGLLIVKAQAIGLESTLSKMIQLVESAQMQKAPIQKLVDQISAVFVPLVVVIAMVTLLGNYYYLNSFSEALLRAVSVLVIACPCALGLATPAAIMAGTGVAAKFGILIRASEVLELAHRIQVIAFDKTGTLTKGMPTLLESIDVNNLQSIHGIDPISLAMGLQAGSEHPLAKAVLEHGQKHAIGPTAFTKITNLPGIGIEGQATLASMGAVKVKIQSLSSLDSEPFFKELLSKVDSQLHKGQTISVMVLETANSALTPISILVFGDEVKSEAKGVISRLKHMGIETVMLSGDNTSSANAVGGSIGMDHIYAQILPEEKSHWIERLKMDGLNNKRIVAMVGDGVNDAPSLVQADVGIAMGTGTTVAMQAASVTLMRGDLNLVFAAIDISKRTWNKIRQNLFWAFVFNTVGIPLAALGLLSPMVAGSAMALSSFFVLSNALLLNNWHPLQDAKNQLPGLSKKGLVKNF